MNIKRIIPIGMSCCLVLGGISYVWAVGNNLIDTKKPNIISVKENNIQNITFETKEIKSSDEFLEMNIELPIIKGMSDTVYQTRLNNKIMENAMKLKGELEKEAKEFSEESKKQGWEFRPYQLHINYDVKSNGDILSFTILNYSYAGGANGILTTDCYNVDMKKGENIALVDMFKEEVDYVKIINDEIKVQIEDMKKQGKVFFDGESGFKSITDAQPFYIEDNNVVIHFDKYEIAPGSEGTIEFKVPMDKLDKYLK